MIERMIQRMIPHYIQENTILFPSELIFAAQSISIAKVTFQLESIQV